eukprot:1183468-Prorocentrum_minimum.AAC.2
MIPGNIPGIFCIPGTMTTTRSRRALIVSHLVRRDAELRVLKLREGEQAQERDVVVVIALHAAAPHAVLLVVAEPPISKIEATR